jgi:hypothetical protein
MTEKQAGIVRDLEMARMKKVQSYIAIRGAANTSENSDVPSQQMSLYSRKMRPVLNYRVNKTRWCVLRWPTPSMAQAANMSTEAFEDFYFDVCTLDYRKFGKAMGPLEKTHGQNRPGSFERPRHGFNLQYQGDRGACVQKAIEMFLMVKCFHALLKIQSTV